MAKKAAVKQPELKAGFWDSVFPNQLGNLCFLVFLIVLALVGLYALFEVNVFDPDEFKSTDERIPALGTRRVVDEAGVLNPGEIDALTRQIDAFEAASGGQMAVLLIRSLYGDPIEDFGLAVAEKWKIGWKDKDNGVVLVLAMEDRRSRLEIGYGYEGVINDARAGDILRNMAPFMRKGEYKQAVSYAIGSVSAFVLDENAPEAPEDDPDDDSEVSVSIPNGPEELLFTIIAICIAFDILGTLLAGGMIAPWVKKSFGLAAMIVIGRILWEVFLAALRSGLRGGGGSSGKSGGGRSGGGGGGFGGGGASGRW